MGQTLWKTCILSVKKVNLVMGKQAGLGENRSTWGGTTKRGEKLADKRESRQPEGKMGRLGENRQTIEDQRQTGKAVWVRGNQANSVGEKVEWGELGA